jgi:hypothetical protein
MTGLRKGMGQHRRFEYLARYSEFRYERFDNRSKQVSGASRASKDVTIIADLLAKDYLGIEKTTTTLSTLATLSAFKKAIEKDEFAFDFDVIALYLRCVRLLCDIRAHCHEHTRVDFQDATFPEGMDLIYVIYKMLLQCDGAERSNKQMFPDAVQMLRRVMEREGSEVIDHAKACEKDRKLQQVEAVSEAEPSFENPFQDRFPLGLRMALAIVYRDENGVIHQPFEGV